MDVPPGRSAAEELRQRRAVAVRLGTGRPARLDPDDRRAIGFAQVLDALITQRRPVYLEIDPDTSAITELFIPAVTRVLAIGPIDEATLRVTLARSHARHLLRRDGPDSPEWEARLRDAIRTGETVVVTENDAHEIIDVRLLSDTGGAEGPIRSPLPGKYAIPKVPWWSYLIPWLYCASATKAQQVFDAMNATSCDPLTVPSPCIPFRYPYDGCFARAHEMCRLMINMGLNPRKVWIKGDLYVETDNDPECHVWWDWHVAPTLCVRGPGFLQTQRMVIDPSLFPAPVTEATWKAKQGDPNATLKDTDAYVYFDASTVNLSSDELDPTYATTTIDLAYYRLQLQVQAVKFGPPPYASCP
jgi:hypothetical protein